jgi:hypothetical protein
LWLSTLGNSLWFMAGFGCLPSLSSFFHGMQNSQKGLNFGIMDGSNPRPGGTKAVTYTIWPDDLQVHRLFEKYK